MARGLFAAAGWCCHSWGRHGLIQLPPALALLSAALPVGASDVGLPACPFAKGSLPPPGVNQLDARGFAEPAATSRGGWHPGGWAGPDPFAIASSVQPGLFWPRSVCRVCAISCVPTCVTSWAVCDCQGSSRLAIPWLEAQLRAAGVVCNPACLAPAAWRARSAALTQTRLGLLMLAGPLGGGRFIGADSTGCPRPEVLSDLPSPRGWQNACAEGLSAAGSKPLRALACRLSARCGGPSARLAAFCWFRGGGGG